MYYHVWPCITMYSHVLPCIAMYNHVLPCTAMYRAVFTWLSKVIEELVWFWFYYALWLASVFTLVLVLRQSSENRSNRCMLSFHLLILPHHFQSQHFPGMRVDLLISLCVSYLGVQPTISHAPSSAKSVATPQHQMTHFLNSLGCKN